MSPTRWLEAESQVRKFGAVIKSPSGYPMLNPYVSLAKSGLTQMHKMVVEFGMTPSSRSRLHIETPKEDDPLDAFLRAGSGPRTTRLQ